MLLDQNGRYITYQSGIKKGQPKMFGAKTLKDMAIADIKSGKAKFMSAGSALDTGFDVRHMRIGITTSRNTSKNKQTQRGYRLTRIDPFQPDAECILVNIYFRMTQDEKWLNKAQEDSESTVYWIETVDEIELNDDEGFEL